MEAVAGFSNILRRKRLQDDVSPRLALRLVHFVNENLVSGEILRTLRRDAHPVSVVLALRIHLENDFLGRLGTNEVQRPIHNQTMAVEHGGWPIARRQEL